MVLKWRARLLTWMAGVLARSWRYQVVGSEHIERLRQEGTPFVLLVWHGLMLPITYLHRHESITLLVSRHRDGGYLAATATR